MCCRSQRRKERARKKERQKEKDQCINITMPSSSSRFIFHVSFHASSFPSQQPLFSSPCYLDMFYFFKSYFILLHTKKEENRDEREKEGKRERR